jgi:predicted PurR-regulated permease PerM
MLQSSRFGLDLRTVRVTWTILVLLAALGLAYALRQVLFLIALSLFFAYLLFPLVHFAQRWGIRSRPLTIAVVYLVVLAILGGAAIAVGPRLAAEVQGLAQKLPEMTRRIQSGEIVVGFLARGGWESQQIREIDRLVQSHMGEIVIYAQQATASVLKWLAGAWVIVLIPVLAFFILKDVERFTSTAIWRLGHEGRRRRVWWGIAEDLHLLLGQYVRALLLLALITFVVWSAVFLAAGAPYALVLAGIGGALEVVPVVGPLTAGVVAIGVCLFAGYDHPWLLALFILVWRLIQDYAVNPLVMARGIDIHPALVIVGVLAGGEIAGVAGMFLAAPVMAAVRIVARRLQAPDKSPVDGDEDEGSAGDVKRDRLDVLDPISDLSAAAPARLPTPSSSERAFELDRATAPPRPDERAARDQGPIGRPSAEG